MMPSPTESAAAEQTRKAAAERRAKRVHGSPSATRSIADAVITKDGDVFMVSAPNAMLPFSQGHGFGLYYHDCRFLKGYEMKIEETNPMLLISSSQRGYMAIFHMTNVNVTTAAGETIAKETLGIRWRRVLEGDKLQARDVLSFRNNGMHDAEFEITLRFLPSFEDVFIIRGFPEKSPGVMEEPAWHDNSLLFSYKGADRFHRRLAVHFSPHPSSQGDKTAIFRIRLKNREEKRITICLAMSESIDAGAHPEPLNDVRFHEITDKRDADAEQWLGSKTKITTDSLLANSVIDKSLRDLAALRSSIHGKQYFAAGVPWYATLFGRDSIITALQTLAVNPHMAEETIRLLCDLQGTHVSEWKDEQPGKILHELRVGELAHLNRIPQTPYYGSIDSTPLFLILIGHHGAWTGDLTLFQQLRGNIERALNWIRQYGDFNHDGYVEYASASEKGLTNQGWKDSGDAIVNEDGQLAKPPIALVEVQGYCYAARLQLALLYERSGDTQTAAQLRREAADLRRTFNRDFWLKDKGIYALALQAGHSPCAVVSSNPGQALWTGIADPDKAHKTAERLMKEDMFSGWGIRTLSTREVRYNSTGYHLGTVWPHDNSLIAAGFKRYGLDRSALRIFSGLMRASMHFKHYQLPEVFSGFSRSDYDEVVPYPVACHPQAWAAGSILHLLETILGLVPEAFENRLRIVRPRLPSFIERLEVDGLQCGKGSVNLLFVNHRKSVSVTVRKRTGNLDVIVEP